MTNALVFWSELNSVREIFRLPSVPRSVTSLQISIFTMKLTHTRTHFCWDCVVLKDTTKFHWNFCFSTLVRISTLEGSKNRLQFLSEDFSFSHTGFLYHSKITDTILQPCIKPLLSSAKTRSPSTSEQLHAPIFHVLECIFFLFIIRNSTKMQ